MENQGCFCFKDLCFARLLFTRRNHFHAFSSTLCFFLNIIRKYEIIKTHETRLVAGCVLCSIGFRWAPHWSNSLGPRFWSTLLRHFLHFLSLCNHRLFFLALVGPCGWPCFKETKSLCFFVFLVAFLIHPCGFGLLLSVLIPIYE